MKGNVITAPSGSQEENVNRAKRHVEIFVHVHFSLYSTHSSEKSQLRWGRHRLETDVCVAGHQSADPELIQSYVKKVSSATRGTQLLGVCRNMQQLVKNKRTLKKRGQTGKKLHY